MRLLPFIAWLVPFDLPVSQARHWALAGTIGNWYLAFLPSVVLAACLVHQLNQAPVGGVSPALIPWVISGVCGVYGAVLAAKVSAAWSVQDCVIGYFVPALLAAGVSLSPKRHEIISALIRGWEIYLLLGIFTLGYGIWQSYSGGSGWQNFAPLQKWTMWRYELANRGNTYALWFGNANKASNLFIPLLLMAPVLLSIDGAAPSQSRMRWIGFLSAIHILAMCSRLGSLLLPVALVAGGYFRPLPRWVLAAAAAIVVAIAAANLSALVEVGRAIFVNPEEAGGGGVLSTFASEGGRFQDWTTIWSAWNPDVGDLLFGSGSGNYGFATFGTTDAETHNYFLDRILAAGLPGLLAVFVALYAAWKGTARLTGRSRWLIRLSIVSFMLMCVREYSPAYLFRTSLAGVVVAILLSMPTMMAVRCNALKEAPR